MYGETMSEILVDSRIIPDPNPVGSEGEWLLPLVHVLVRYWRYATIKDRHVDI